MPRVYPVIVKRTTVTGGTGNVGWGPNFGGLDGDQFGCGVGLLPFEPPAVEIPKTCGCNLDLEKLDLTHGKTCGCTISSFTADPTANKTCACNLDLETVNLGHNKTCGCNLDLYAIDPVGAKTAGTHLSGTVTGAPFWQREDHASGAGADLANITVTYAAGAPADGTLLLMSVGVKGSSAPAPDVPSGWTYRGQVVRSEAELHRLTVYHRVASGESSSQMVILSGVVTDATATIHQIVGYDTTTPINTSSTSDSSSINITAPSVTTSVANCLVFYLTTHLHIVTQSHTPPSSHAELTEFETGAVDAICSNDGSRVYTASGATGSVTVSCDELTASVALAFRVAIAPGTTTIAS